LKKKVGLTLGKFAPLHKGHQFLIETALSEVDEVIILIYEAHETEIPLYIRANWLRKLYPQTRVVEAWDGPQMVGNTPDICQTHEDYILGLLGGEQISHFYSGEFYGDHISKALGAHNRLVDPDRCKYEISATMIRSDPYTFREYVHPIVYDELITRVVFLGAPCTGKTTLAEEMARQYETVWMPEYGRDYWEAHQTGRRLSSEQLLVIARGHLERENELVYQAKRYLFVDTNALTTYQFALDYHGFALPALELLARQAVNSYDLVFLCSDDIPYENTWDRSGSVKREVFQKCIIDDLEERQIAYVELEGVLMERVNAVKRELSMFSKYIDPSDNSSNR
jgi:HTH-type transcriptional regulator, transcriptional repressor of NAD biosynthesis genes